MTKPVLTAWTARVLAAAIGGACVVVAAQAQTITIGIGTQDTTTNTVTTGVVIRELKLLAPTAPEGLFFEAKHGNH
jgi:NitT/TauT family transport system substrate-binding protein